VTSISGEERGAFFLPDIEDEVLVGFEYGDIERLLLAVSSPWTAKLLRGCY
jgi:uncharacterized protein involved in type VI secretion and phage assembly